MTVENTLAAQLFTGNGATTSFPTDIYALAAGDLVVATREISTGTDTALVLDTDYSVSNVGVTGGVTITYPLSGSPLAATHKLVVSREMDLTQELDIRNQSGFDPDTLETELDREVLMIQQVKELTDRAVKVPVGESGGLVASSAAIGEAEGYAEAAAASALAAANSEAAAQVGASPKMAVTSGSEIPPLSYDSGTNTYTAALPGDDPLDIPDGTLFVFEVEDSAPHGSTIILEVNGVTDNLHGFVSTSPLQMGELITVLREDSEWQLISRYNRAWPTIKYEPLDITAGDAAVELGVHHGAKLHLCFRNFVAPANSVTCGAVTLRVAKGSSSPTYETSYPCMIGTLSGPSVNENMDYNTSTETAIPLTPDTVDLVVLSLDVTIIGTDIGATETTVVTSRCVGLLSGAIIIHEVTAPLEAQQTDTIEITIPADAPMGRAEIAITQDVLRV